MSAVLKPSWRQTHGIIPPAGWSDDDRVRFAEYLLSFQDRPWDWVLECYPWGQTGSPLQKKMPELWQRRLLLSVQLELQRTDLSLTERWKRVIRVTTAAGNGVGKTALVAWIVHWFMSVYPNGEAIVTAGTGDQLSGKTWRELAKWRHLAINGWQFDWTATRYTHKDLPSTWFAEARTWSEANPAAMAGTHENYVLVIFDEASAISKIIWETIEGAFTTGLCFFFAFGNPTNLDDGFYETHHGLGASRWLKFRVDAREVSFANKEEIEHWIQIHGIDSDFVRIHVYGQFPRQSDLQFIDSAAVRDAANRVIQWREIPAAIPKLMGCDIARQGVDLNSIVRRQGPKMGKEIREFGSRDLMATADMIAREINEWHPDLVYIDGVGMGAGVVDYLRMRGFERIIVDVQSGTTPKDKNDAVVYGNMRAVMWTRMREWLRTADIVAHQGLMEELCGPHFRYMPKTERLLIESKDDMRARGVKSPNIADALSHTFWHAIPMANTRGSGVGYAESDM